jgi:hypothetical protein
MVDLKKIKLVANLKAELHRGANTRQCLPTFHSKHNEPVLVIKSFIDKTDIENIQVLSDFVKLNYPSQCVDREFQKVVVDYIGDEMVINENDGIIDNPAVYGGGNDVIFIEGHMQEILPLLLEHIRMTTSQAALNAKWYPHCKQLGIRCIESLLYTSGGSLYMHTDSESIFTIVIMLSDPCSSDFTGGDFLIRHGESSIRIALKQGEAIMFDSCSLHGVDSIITGERNVLVLELWPYEDAVKGDHRPSIGKYSNRQKIPTFFQEP